MYDVYVFETTSFLQRLDGLLMQSEKDGEDILSAVPEIFRIMHTIKSSSAMMLFDRIAKLAHALEDLFAYLREHRPASFDASHLADIVLSCSDFIKCNIAEPDNQQDPHELIRRVADYLEYLKRAAPAAPQVQPPPVKLRVYFKPDCHMVSLRALELQHKLSRSVQSVFCAADDKSPDAAERIRKDGLLFTIAAQQSGEELVALALSASPFIDRAEIESGIESKIKSEIKKAAENLPVPPAESTSGFIERRSDSSSRRAAVLASIAMDKVDTLVDLTGELLLAYGRIRSIFNQGDYDLLDYSLTKLGKMILVCRQTALSIRMMPLTDTVHKLNRGLRDMARKQGKDVEFVASGEDAEVDRSIADALFTPLMHITRNALDHGIETPDERIRFGKPPRGRIEVAVSVQENDVVVAVIDDGRGFDRPRILEKALAVGLVSEKRASEMSDEEIDRLVYAPGFSTSECVTEYSGRGVGMDVVNESARRLKGQISISSVAGKGSRIEFRVPRGYV